VRVALFSCSQHFDVQHARKVQPNVQPPTPLYLSHFYYLYYLLFALCTSIPPSTYKDDKDFLQKYVYPYGEERDLMCKCNEDPWKAPKSLIPCGIWPLA